MAALERSFAGKRPSLTSIALAGLVGVLIWFRWGGVRRGIWADLDVYVRGAAAVLRHEPLYSVSSHGLPFTYPPFSAVLFVPLELLGDLGARWALTLASLACYVVVVTVCARRLRMRPAAAAMIGLAGLAFEPFMSTIMLGQVNLVLLALVVLDCLVVPARYRGMLIGLAAGIKLLPGVFVLFLLLKREWWAAGRALAAFAATVAVGAAFAPADSWTFWRGGFINLSRWGTEAMLGGDNQSLNAAYLRLSGDLSPSSILVLLMSLGALALGIVAARRQIDSGNEVNALVCLGFASMLASPISWTHHWVWAVLALMVLVHGGYRAAAGVLGLVFVAGAMWLAPRGQFLELSHSWWQAAVCVSYVAVGLAYLAFFATDARVREPARPAERYRLNGRRRVTPTG